MRGHDSKGYCIIILSMHDGSSQNVLTNRLIIKRPKVSVKWEQVLNVRFSTVNALMNGLLLYLYRGK